MNIKFLGTGGAFDFEKGTAAAIVDVAGKKILIDCGFSTLPKLADTGLASEIDYFLITHLHADHFGSFPMLLGYIQHRIKKPVPEIIVPSREFQSQIDSILRIMRPDKEAVFASVDEFPEIGYIETTDQHLEGMMSFAYYFVEGDELIYYSGDIGNAGTAKQFLDNRNESKITVFHETTPRTDIAVHASYKEVAAKLAGYDVYTYHIAKENMPADSTLKYVEDHPEFLV